MTLTKLILSVSIATLGATAAPAFAAGQTLTIKDFIGTITVETSPNAELRVTKKSNSGDVKINDSRNSLTIDGGIDRLDGDDCKGFKGNISWSLFGKKEKTKQIGGYEDLEDHPNLTISAPDTVEFIVENAIPFGDIGDIGSADIEMRHCGRLTIGNIAGRADLSITGNGDIHAKNIRTVDARVTGSGDLEFENTGDADLSTTGSGNIDFNNAENVDLRSSGSSDVEMERISGHLTVSSSGSSDISVDYVGGGLTYTGGGSGDFYADEVNGDTEISVNGSGDVDIRDGNIGILAVNAGGSSDVGFGGTAKDAVLTARGSSDISVNHVTGVSEIKTSGSADIDIND